VAFFFNDTWKNINDNTNVLFLKYLLAPKDKAAIQQLADYAPTLGLRPENACAVAAVCPLYSDLYRIHHN
jgi:hypothetical protein